jgi:hypothetical protein
MERDATPNDEPERSRIGRAAATEGKNRKSDFRTGERIGDKIRAGLETNPHSTRDQSGRDSEYDPSAQRDEPMNDQQPRYSFAGHRHRSSALLIVVATGRDCVTGLQLWSREATRRRTQHPGCNKEAGKHEWADQRAGTITDRQMRGSGSSVVDE